VADERSPPAGTVDWPQAHRRVQRLGQRLDAQPDPALLARRAQLLAATPPAATAAEIRPYVAYRRGGGRYAVPLAQAGEAIAMRGLFRLPCTPAHILGLALHKGQPVPAIELSWFLDDLELPANPPARLLVADVAAAAFALAADVIEGVRPVDMRVLAAGRRPFVAGITGDMLTLLDLDVLAGDARFVVNEEVGGRAG